MLGDWAWCPAGPPQSHLLSGVWKAAAMEGRTALCSARALGALSATAPNPRAATAFQINSVALPGSLSAPGRAVHLRSPVAGPCPLRAALTSSLARLGRSPSFSHPLSLSVTLCLFFSSPFVSRTCLCSPSQAHFLSSLPSSSRLLVSLLGPCQGLATRPPSPVSPHLETLLNCFLLGEKNQNKEVAGPGEHF